MNDTAYVQQAAIRARRDEQRRLSGWAQFTCPNPRCAVDELNAFVQEDVDVKPFQSPNKCIRCGSILVWEGWGV